MRVLKPPKDLIGYYEGMKLFLAGSIEMGTAEDWQTRIQEELKNTKVTIYNPRRDDWDSTWVQKIDNPQFREQVMWELRAMEDADYIAMYFSPGTKSPITLLELGLHAPRKPNRLIVFCPEGFWRKGNVDIVCRKYGVINCVSWQDFVCQIKEKI